MFSTPHLADRTAWSASVAVFLSGVIADLQVGKVAVALPVLQADFDLDLAAAGWIGAIFAVLGAATGSLAGVAVGRFGDTRTFLAGMLTLAAGSGLGSLAHDFPTLLATRVIEGCGFLLAVVAAPVVLQRIVTAKDREPVFALWSSFMQTGIGIALLLGAKLTGWRGAWALNGVMVAGAALLLALTVPRNYARAGQHRSLRWHRAYQDRIRQPWRSTVRAVWCTPRDGPPQPCPLLSPERRAFCFHFCSRGRE
jgi:MFS family permease